MNISEQFSSAAQALESWAQETLFQDAHREATLLLDVAVDVHLIRLYRDLNFHDLLKGSPTARALSDALEFEASAHIALEPLLLRLAERHDFLKVELTGESYQFTPLEQPRDQSALLPQLQASMASLGEDYTATLEFLEFGETHFLRSLRDDHEFMDRVLTGQEKAFAETWHRATNTDPLQDIHGIMGAKALELLFTHGSILEVGGGTGNGLRNNLDALKAADQLDALQQYIFTDVSMPFILNTKRELASRYPQGICKWQLLNINKDWLKQRVEPQSVEYIYGVNAAHIAQHTVNFMQECIQTLKPDGIVVFSERLRGTPTEMAPREIVLNQSLYHRTAAIRDPEFRPAHAYLTRDNWLTACELAGFSEYAVWPSVESLNGYFPEQYAAVIVARK